MVQLEVQRGKSYDPGRAEVYFNHVHERAGYPARSCKWLKHTPNGGNCLMYISLRGQSVHPCYNRAMRVPVHISVNTIRRLKRVQTLLDQLDPEAAPQALVVPGSP